MLELAGMPGTQSSNYPMKCSVSRLRMLASAFVMVLSLQARVLDNFDDNSKTSWTDFTFVPGVGLPVEENGHFKFEIPGAVLVQAKQGLFTASQKVSDTIELKEGRRVEFRVDLIKGGAKDSFAVLGFLPTGNSPGTLAGYSLAKSTTDVLITKGINKYFVADSGATAEVKNENVTLVLSLTALNGNVTINAKVLDKENNNAVLWEKTVVDTPAADVLVAGSDSPATPYITSGYFTLFCYADYDSKAVEDPYTVTYDNAEVYVTDMTLLDDFNDNSKTSWTDFTFVPGIGLPVEQNSQFKFEIPGAVLVQAKQGLFSASQKTSREFALTEGERVEFSVDLVAGGAKDSFAVLGFLPIGNSPGTLAGYSLAKSTTDILITKGINKYFVADAGAAAALKNENVTLDLALTAKNGSVIMEAKVLDKDNNNAVLWQKTVIDTPAADVLVAGTDSPAAPYIASGYFTLFCYADYDSKAVEDPYTVTYDNAIVFSPPVAANLPPVFSNVQPAEFASFLPVATQVSFAVTDDKPLSNDKLSVTLNGTKFTSANGLTVTGSGNTRTASLSGLVANANYTAVLNAEDADGATTSKTIYFDTFSESNLVIELEDYNFDGGSFIDNPALLPEGSGPQADSYSMQSGVADVDFSDTRTAPAGDDTPYRQLDPVRMQPTRDNARAKYVAAAGSGALDYDIGDIAANEWLNYTRTFPAGSYEVYLREALANMATGDSVLEQVTSDPKQPGQSTKVLGSFHGTVSGFQYRNFALTDGSGVNKAILQLSGPTTLRLRQVTADPGDGARYQNYLIFVPSSQSGVQRPTVATLSPSGGSTIDSVSPAISATILNRDTKVDTNSIKLFVNGQLAPATVTPTADGASLAYNIAPLPPSGSAVTGRLEFADSDNVLQTNEWSFTLTYNGLDPANRASGTPGDRGFKVRVVQAPVDLGALENSLARAEDQLSPNSTIAKFVDTNTVAQVINFNGVGGDGGQIPGDEPVPGLDPDINGTHDFAMEIQGYLELTAGVHRFGVISDDGFSVRSGTSTTDKTSIPLAFRNGSADQRFDFVVPQAGLYPFRMVWYERGGSSYVEWFSEDPNTGEKTLINDPNSPNAVKAYLAVAGPSLVVESSANAAGPYAVDPSAIVDETKKTITAAIGNSGARFFRLRTNGGGAGEQPRLSSPSLTGATFSVGYSAP